MPLKRQPPVLAQDRRPFGRCFPLSGRIPAFAGTTVASTRLVSPLARRHLDVLERRELYRKPLRKSTADMGCYDRKEDLKVGDAFCCVGSPYTPTVSVI